MISPLQAGGARAQPPQAQPAARAGQLWAELIATALTVAVALGAALLLRTVFYQPFTIPSASMEPGLVEGDYILVSKFSYGWSGASLPLSGPIGRGRLLGRDPDRGDVVVFKGGEDGRTAIIKRVIGLPGDRVQLSRGVVLVNGRALPQSVLDAGSAGDPPVRPVVIQERSPAGRSYLTLDRGPGREGDDTGVYLVPADHLFVLGDNRDNSADSRWPAGYGVGLAPTGAVVGEAQAILLSWTPGASVLKPWTWLSLRPDRLFTPIR